MSVLADDTVCFNVVWTGSVFDHLKYFVASQLDQCGARFRYCINGCPADQILAIEGFASTRPDRIVDVSVISADDMISHGKVLDAVRDRYDDGPYFGLIDPDIVARGPFLSDFVAAFADGAAAVSSGRGIWCETDVIPDGHLGVNGEYFYAANGFLFGSPHFAVYRRDVLEETCVRWSIGFGSGGPGLNEAATQRLAEADLQYYLYDTGKLVNAFLQLDGHRIVHNEHPNLLHIGGMSHYLSPPTHICHDDNPEPEPDWARWEGMSSRFEVARYSAAVLRAVAQGQPAPALPLGLAPPLHDKLITVRQALIELLARHGAVRDEGR